jgi:hypothetical protein
MVQFYDMLGKFATGYTVRLCLCQISLQFCDIFAKTHHSAKNRKFTLLSEMIDFEENVSNFLFWVMQRVLAKTQISSVFR